MNLEGKKLSNWNPNFYCEACKKHQHANSVFIEYNSLAEHLKRTPEILYGAADENYAFVQDTNERTPILSNDCNSPSSFTSLGYFFEKRPKRQSHQDFEIAVLKDEIKRLNEIMKRTDLSAEGYSTDGPVGLAIKRLPALLLTLSLELIGGIIIANFKDVIKRYTLITSFMVPLSALSGTFIKISFIFINQVSV